MTTYILIDRLLIYHSLFSINALGYLAEYTEKWKDRDMTHKVYMLNSVKGTKGINIIMDCAKSLFPEVEKEFLAAMKSIRIDE